MSAIRTLDELQDAMSVEFAWRKKELHGIKSLVAANEKTHNRKLFIRAAIPLLYAHWEGFIKQIGLDYLEFVARRRLSNSKLSPHFLAMAVGQLVRNASSNSRIGPCLELVQFFESAMDSRSRLPMDDGIDTKSNLTSSVLQEIVTTLGLDYSRFSTKEKLLDEKLLNNRNHIAHGQYLAVDFDEYMKLHEEILALMQDFYNQVENAALIGTYRR